MGCGGSKKDIAGAEKKPEVNIESKHESTSEKKPIIGPSENYKENLAESHEQNKVPDQAGGHAGSLFARGDKLLKRAGKAELAFYQSLFDMSNQDEDMIAFRKFVPTYYCTESIEGKDYLVLENLLTGYDHPNILDCKVGKVTWTKDHNERKTADQKAKAEKTTTGSLGFRISGLVVKDLSGKTVESFAKDEGFYSITADSIHEMFRKIVGDDTGQIEKFIEQTNKLIEWFKSQRSKHFFTASVFYVVGKNGKSQTRFIDFAHVYEAEGEPDHSNYYLDVIQGLESVVAIWQRLLN